ncbi:MAG: hypothetical protein C5S44_03935 [Candidatus Methanocomedens sp.]|nr:MAG: hypothetical protein C5S44_03935 [ANME-2 cluster archaeon]
MLLFGKNINKNTHKITEPTTIKISGSNIMGIKIIITHIFCISLILLGTGCIDGEYTQELEIAPDPAYTEPQYSPEMQQLIDFLKVDKVNEVSVYQDPYRGVDYYVCSGFSRDLAQNAKEYDIDMGAISIRDTMAVGIGTRYNHAMNYCIIDEEFILVEPQTDEIFTLEDIKQSPDFEGYEYISIYQNAQMMSNYGKGRETVDIDLYGGYNESDILIKFPPISN